MKSELWREHAVVNISSFRINKIKPAGYENKYPSNERDNRDGKIRRTEPGEHRRSDQVQLKRSARRPIHKSGCGKETAVRAVGADRRGAKENGRKCVINRPMCRLQNSSASRFNVHRTIPRVARENTQTELFKLRLFQLLFYFRFYFVVSRFMQEQNLFSTCRVCNNNK